MAQYDYRDRSSHGSNHQEERRDGDRGVLWEHATEHVTTAAVLILFFLSMAIIFADLWVSIIPCLLNAMEVVGDPLLFILSIVMFITILWNISFYLEKRKELRVARKLIRWVAAHRYVTPRKDKERERLDRVLKDAIWALRNGEDVRVIIDGLNERTHGGEALPAGWARSHYETAIERLMDAAGRDHVLAWEERERVLQEAEMMLWATRADSLRGRV